MAKKTKPLSKLATARLARMMAQMFPEEWMFAVAGRADELDRTIEALKHMKLTLPMIEANRDAISSALVYLINMRFACDRQAVKD